MKALNFEGSMLIEDSKIKRIINLHAARVLASESIDCIKLQNIGKAKKNIESAHELICKSRRAAFIVVKGLTPLVLNETTDTENRNELADIRSELYNFYCKLCKLGLSTQKSGDIVNYSLPLRIIIKNISLLLSNLTKSD